MERDKEREELERKLEEAKRVYAYKSKLEDRCFDAWWEGYRAALPAFAALNVGPGGRDPATFGHMVEQEYRARSMQRRDVMNELAKPILELQEQLNRLYVRRLGG